MGTSIYSKGIQRRKLYLYLWVSNDCFSHTSYKRLARKRCKCCKESKKSNVKYNEKWLATYISLLHISINGPHANNKEAEQLLERVCNAYANEKHKKISQVYSLGKTEASSSTDRKQFREYCWKLWRRNELPQICSARFLSSFFYDIKFYRGGIFWRRW